MLLLPYRHHLLQCTLDGLCILDVLVEQGKQLHVQLQGTHVARAQVELYRLEDVTVGALDLLVGALQLFHGGMRQQCMVMVVLLVGACQLTVVACTVIV